MLISLQQDSLRIGDQVAGVLEISNQSDVGADAARFMPALPASLALHCRFVRPLLRLGALDLGPLPPHSVKSQPFCLTLDFNTAHAGSFNLLFEVTYTWAQKTDLVTAEKTIQVDLIGNQTILGLPLAFAGFILPGLMFLITLRWFKAPWAVGLSGEDKLIYGVLLSLVLLGPFALLGSLPDAPGWVQFLNFSQDVTIPRLAVYVLIGLAFGGIAGVIYQKVKADQARRLAAQQA